MIYGYFITDTLGNERFFVEGCNCCQMSTGGQHEPNCPCKDLKVDARAAAWAAWAAAWAASRDAARDAEIEWQGQRFLLLCKTLI